MLESVKEKIYCTWRSSAESENNTMSSAYNNINNLRKISNSSSISLAIESDRPFNLKGGYGFLFRSKKNFRTTQELEFFFLSRET
jgi:hypothetical protein